MQPNGKKVLIIEDENLIADIYKHELEKVGFEVTVAYDGNSGSELLKKYLFDILLLDIMLPGVNGLALLRQWRIENPQSTMPVLLLTNLGQEEVIKEAFTLGAQGYLIKVQYTPQQVVKEVENALFASKTAQTINPLNPTVPGK